MPKKRKQLGIALMCLSIMLVVMYAGREPRSISASQENETVAAELRAGKRSEGKKARESTMPSAAERKAMEEMAELELLACCTFAEAGNQGYEGMRKVTAVILNRVNDERFPDTIADVILQKNQFEVVSRGTIYTVDPTEECFNAVRDELTERSDTDILFFRTGRYSDYGTPAYKYRDHYFSY